MINKVNWIRFAPSVKHGKKHLMIALNREYPGCKFSKVQVKRNYQRKYRVSHISGWKAYSMRVTIKCSRVLAKSYF